VGVIVWVGMLVLVGVRVSRACSKFSVAYEGDDSLVVVDIPIDCGEVVSICGALLNKHPARKIENRLLSARILYSNFQIGKFFRIVVCQKGLILF